MFLFIFIFLRGDSRKELFLTSEKGQQYNILYGDDNLCEKIMALWALKMRNEHVLISALVRDHGTNYSTNQRILLFTVYVFIILAMSAWFYGNKQQAVINCFFLDP